MVWIEEPEAITMVIILQGGANRNINCFGVATYREGGVKTEPRQKQ